MGDSSTADICSKQYYNFGLKHFVCYPTDVRFCFAGEDLRDAAKNLPPPQGFAAVFKCELALDVWVELIAPRSLSDDVG